MRISTLAIISLSTLTLIAAQTVLAQANVPVYTDNLVNSFQDWSYSCTRSFTNTSPVNSGSYSISVTITSSGGTLYLHSPNFNTGPYTNISFWINGGLSGGQHLQVRGVVNGNGQTAYPLPTLTANTWQQFTIPLSSLSVANNPNFDGIMIQGSSGGAQPIYYVDDIQIGAGSTPALVNLNVDVTQTNRTADARWFGVNTATWDGSLSRSSTLSALQEAGVQSLRWPGGSTADTYHWASDSKNTTFNALATNLGAQVFITVNYGSGTSNEAAAWVLSANTTNLCHFKYWEVGNECYGSWEMDINTNAPYSAYDPWSYAMRFRDYYTAMKAADPTIKIGAVVTPGDDSYANNTSHPAYNSRTGTYHNGWTPVMLATLKSLGITPDFLVHHVYPQYTPTPWTPPAASPDSDPLLLQAGSNWAIDAATLRQEINDYFGTGGTNIELCCTENNSDSSGGGRQLSSLVNALYMADSLSRLMQTEFNSFLWWDLRNGAGTGGDFDPTLYGWRTTGDFGILTGSTSRNPPFYSLKLMQYFARGGDTVLNASSDYVLLSDYAVQKADGLLNVLVINKDVGANFTGQINLGNFVPVANAAIHSYGISQDNATKNGLSASLQDIAVTNYPSAASQFSYTFPPYSMTLFTFTPAAPYLQASPVASNQFVFQLQGQAGVPYIIQTSPDLMQWVSVSTNKLTSTTMTVTNTVTPGPSAQFWRAVWQP